MQNILILSRAMSQVFGDKGLFIKDDFLYWRSPDGQVVKQMTVEMVQGGRDYRLWFKAGCLVDSIHESELLRSAKQKTSLWIPDDYTYLLRVALGLGDAIHVKHGAYTHYKKYVAAELEESICQDLEGFSDLFLTHFWEIQRVEDLYNYRMMAYDKFEEWKKSPKALFIVDRPMHPMFKLNLLEQQLYPEMQLRLWEKACITAQECMHCFPEIKQGENYDGKSERAQILQAKERDVQTILFYLKRGDYNPINALVVQRSLASKEACETYFRTSQ